MWCSTYHHKWNDMYYPYRIVLPSNILKLIPLYIKQTWVHYLNLCAIIIRYRTFFKGWHQWKPTQIIKNLPLWHWWKHYDEILNSYHSCSPFDHLSPWNHASDGSCCHWCQWFDWLMSSDWLMSKDWLIDHWCNIICIVLDENA